MGGRSWTKEEDSLTQTLIDCGYTAQEIADELERGSKFAVYKRLVRRKVKMGRKPPVDPDARSLTIGMLARGMTVPEIATSRGISPQSVREMIARLVAEGLIERVGRFKSRRYKAGWRAIRYRPTVNWYGGNPGEGSRGLGNDQTPLVSVLRDLTADTLRDEDTSMSSQSPPGRGFSFPLYPGKEVRLATDNPLSNGKLGRVVSLHDWGAVLETNFATRSYRATWNEMEPVAATELVNPEVNGHGHYQANGKPFPTPAPTPTGNSCPNCQGVNLVRTGSCVTCQDCGANEGCG